MQPVKLNAAFLHGLLYFLSCPFRTQTAVRLPFRGQQIKMLKIILFTVQFKELHRLAVAHNVVKFFVPEIKTERRRIQQRLEPHPELPAFFRQFNFRAQIPCIAGHNEIIQIRDPYRDNLRRYAVPLFITMHPSEF